MMRIVLLIVCIGLFVQCCLSAVVDVVGVINVNSRENIPSNTNIVLTSMDGDVYSTLALEDGRFKFKNIPSGETYLLQVHAIPYHFDPVLIEISKKSVITANILSNDTETYTTHPLLLNAVYKSNYFQPRLPYDFTSLFRNPMVLMIGVTMLMTFAMPKLMANMDPETIKEMQGESQPPKTLQPLPDWKLPALT
eukprot:TRINITY_DN4085_c0_g2_i1.p1 TRINITY_DN4085_c0_g2~~TRINITY_DN4085_c0_g2_i1.p1  ORF type:complete len:194 (+),score=26.54 TRINITY_DN4085_c0_g2_i1:128-709(+)